METPIVSSGAAPETLTAAVEVTTDTRSMIVAGQAAADVARSFEIDSPDMAAIVSQRRNDNKAAIKQLETMMGELTEPARKIIETARSWFQPAIQARKEADAVYSGLLVEWNQREQRRIADENRARKEAADKARREAEEKAAAERARAEQVAREEREKQEAAERDRRQAEEAARKAREEAIEAERQGKAEEAAQALARAQEEARKAAEAAAERAAAETRARTVVQAAEQTALVATMTVEAIQDAPVTVAKVAGTGFREKWVPELQPGVTADEAKRLIAEACTANPSLLGLLKVDETALRKLAEALHEAMAVPGYYAKKTEIAVAARSRS